jgi:hypothetical protein
MQLNDEGAFARDLRLDPHDRPPENCEQGSIVT